MRWPTNKEEHAYMKGRKEENKAKSARNKAENWMAEKLEETEYKWSMQTQWGYRVFDFWNHYLGIAIEVDGDSHDPEYDRVRDEYNLKKSAIKVIRVRNFNEEDAKAALKEISISECWNDRRRNAGLKPITYAGKEALKK